LVVGRWRTLAQIHIPAIRRESARPPMWAFDAIAAPNIVEANGRLWRIADINHEAAGWPF